MMLLWMIPASFVILSLIVVIIHSGWIQNVARIGLHLAAEARPMYANCDLQPATRSGTFL
jgi:hypothetical protein